jgi:hypothetical protein
LDAPLLCRLLSFYVRMCVSAHHLSPSVASLSAAGTSIGKWMESWCGKHEPLQEHTSPLLGKGGTEDGATRAHFVSPNG